MQRVKFRCEYCLLHEDDAAFPHEVDHIISRQHGGGTSAPNLAYEFMVCNRYKGSNIASVGSSGELAPLFNPRKADRLSVLKASKRNWPPAFVTPQEFLT